MLTYVSMNTQNLQKTPKHTTSTNINRLTNYTNNYIKYKYNCCGFVSLFAGIFAIFIRYL